MARRLRPGARRATHSDPDAHGGGRLDSELERELQDRIDGLVADIAATGRGRNAVRAEIATLLQAVQLVLRQEAKEPAGIQRFVTAACGKLLRELRYLSGAGSDTFVA